MPWKLLIEALGATVRIDLSTLPVADAEAVRAAWADATLTDAVGPVVEVPAQAPSGERAASSEALLADLSQRVTLAAIESRRGREWMLHATGLADEQGRVVVLVGPSGRGKTTAARTLGTRFGYVSDETVAIGDDGRVLPYRKPLSIIEAPGAPKAQRAPSSLGLRPLPDAPLRLAAIVLLDRRDDGPRTPRVEQVDLGDALADLVAQSSYLADAVTPLQAMAAHAASVGGIHRITYRDAASLAPAVEALLAAAPAPAPAAQPALVFRVSDAGAAPAAPLHTRAPHADALALDDPDRIALLHVDDAGHGTVFVLGGIAPALWRAADGVSAGALRDAAVAAHGDPEGADAAVAVDAAIDELVEAGVLVRAEAPVWRIEDEVAWTDRDGRVVALALADPALQPLALEGSAALIWRAAAEGPGTTAEVVDRVADAAGTTPAEIADDVGGFLADLEARGLARRS